MHHLIPIRLMTDMFKAMFFPKGPMRPAGGVQRGSVADMTIFTLAIL